VRASLAMDTTATPERRELNSSIVQSDLTIFCIKVFSTVNYDAHIIYAAAQKILPRE